MAKWHDKLDVTDPERVIGQTPDGKPVWVDMRELLTSPDERLAMLDGQAATKQQAVVQRMASDVVDRGMLLMAQTLDDVLSPSAKAQLNRCTDKKAVDFISRMGFSCIQDGLTTVIKRHGTVLRTQHADVAPAWRDRVARQVRVLVGEPKVGI